MGGGIISYAIYPLIILLIAGIILSCIGLYLLDKANNIKIDKNLEIEKQKQEKNQLKHDIKELFNEKSKLILDIQKEKQNYDESIEKEKNKLSEQLEIYKQNINYAKEQYFETLENNLLAAESEHDVEMRRYIGELKDTKKKLDEIKNSLSAGIQAQLREREKEENLQFYKLSISPIDLEDIVKLNSLKTTLHNPIILSKLIWSTYFQKQANELCNRVFGKETVCGIYKITNVKTKQCYIGQSVNCQDRIKSHIKCGLGIDAPATNKLYNSMQSEGVWNYAFELIEKCTKEELDKKEKWWIEMYQSREFGYNSTRGNN